MTVSAPSGTSLVTGKLSRAVSCGYSFASQWQAGNVDILYAPWNEALFRQYESFPESKFKDMVDAGSSAFNELNDGVSFNIRSLNS